MNNTVRTTIPFSGFYHSIHDHQLDGALDLLCSDSATGCTIFEGVRERMFNLVDWREAHTLYAKRYTKALSSEFDLDLTYEDLDSPKYYNYSTDRIFCTIPFEKVQKIYASVPLTTLSERIKQNFTSCDGFISHYPNTLTNWGALETWDHNQIGTLLECYIEQILREEYYKRDLSDLEYRIIEDLEPYAIIHDALPNTKETERLFTILDYLNKRSERNQRSTR